MRSHPRAGVDMLEGSQWSPLVKSIVLRHHERWDGSGYPDGKRGEEIHPMARIAAVADVFDAITSERLYAPARPAATASGRSSKAPAASSTRPSATPSGSVVAPFPAGTAVELTDGSTGVVVSAPEGALDRPVVRILEGDQAESEISLLDVPQLGISGWDQEPAARIVAA